MKLGTFWDTYFTVKRLKRLRQENEKMLDSGKEKCENFFREDDDENDGRGNF